MLCFQKKTIVHSFNDSLSNQLGSHQIHFPMGIGSLLTPPQALNIGDLKNFIS